MPVTVEQILGKTGMDVTLTVTGGAATYTIANPRPAIPENCIIAQISGTGTTIVFNRAASTAALLSFTVAGNGVWAITPLYGRF